MAPNVGEEPICWKPPADGDRALGLVERAAQIRLPGHHDRHRQQPSNRRLVEEIAFAKPGDCHVGVSRSGNPGGRWRCEAPGSPRCWRTAGGSGRAQFRLAADSSSARPGGCRRCEARRRSAGRRRAGPEPSARWARTGLGPGWRTTIQQHRQGRMRRVPRPRVQRPRGRRAIVRT